jgi:UDP-hydrolysing UDP-N-acetyl-D-glucosamine 2-epimerase
MRVRRTIAVVTTGRADYGLLVPVLRAARENPELEPAVYATGAHLSERHGRTVDRIEADEWEIAARVETEGDRDRPVHEKIALAVRGFGDAFAQHRPDVCVLLGDRFETIAAALAAASTGTPIAHIHGGEISTGAIDNQYRYAITALASLHCVATERTRDRLVAMGEDPRAVVRTGAPGLDALAGFEPMPRDAFAAEVGLRSDGPFLLVTLHPTTISGENPADHARALLAALDDATLPCLVTAANQDDGGDAINDVLRSGCAERGWPFADALGPGLYHNAMHHAEAMVGNSSSGIIEAASFGLPVVNIGDRQAGRESSGNVVDCGHDAAGIAEAIDAARTTRGERWNNVYGDGGAGPRIAEAIAAMPLGTDALRKRFEPPGL